MSNLRFSENSFLDEITNPAQAQQCLAYLSQNMQEFKRELSEQGYSYTESQDLIKKVWMNLVASAKRVGYKDPELDQAENYYAE